jgi:tetratricopeptide (TPR) repeat protein
MTGTSSVDRAIGQSLVDGVRRADSGILTARRGKLKRLFCLVDGRLVHAISNVVEEQPEARLLERGLLTPEGLSRAGAASERTRTALLRSLVEREIVPLPTLKAALGDHLRELLFATLDWPDGEASFTRGRPDIEAPFTVEIPPIGLLLEYARSRPKGLDEVRVRIGSPGLRPIFEEERGQLLSAEPADALTAWLLERCDGRRRIGELVEGSPAAPELTWRRLYGLLLAGILVPDVQGRRVARKDDVTREEILARLERTRGTDHYTVLELNPGCTSPEIREAYYFLARRYHPDRFRSGPLADLRGRIESYFTQVTEAYNTLHDPQLRASYDEQREGAAGADKPVVEQDTGFLARQNYLRAKNLLERGRFTDAVRWLENAIQLDGRQAAYHLELGRLLSGNPRLRQRAEQHLGQATQLDPTLVDGYLALGELYRRMDRLADAARMFREVLRWEPGHLEAGRQLQELGESRA